MVFCNCAGDSGSVFTALRQGSEKACRRVLHRSGRSCGHSCRVHVRRSYSRIPDMVQHMDLATRGARRSRNGPFRRCNGNRSAAERLRSHEKAHAYKRRAVYHSVYTHARPQHHLRKNVFRHAVHPACDAFRNTASGVHIFARHDLHNDPAFYNVI